MFKFSTWHDLFKNCFKDFIYLNNRRRLSRSCNISFYNSFFSVVFLYAIGVGVLNLFSIISGLIIYAKYSDCDPFATGQVSRNDQLLPYYVMDVAGNVPGLPGLFIAGVVSAGLRYSTISPLKSFGA